MPDEFPRQPLCSRRCRFWAKVEVGGPDECWPWTASLDSHGYGKLCETTNGRVRTMLAHRLSWEWANGRPPPRGMMVLHSCDRPACQNPAHLSLGTGRDNMQQMAARGRAGAQVHPESQSRGEARPAAKLTDEKVRAIRAAHKAGVSQKALAEANMVSGPVIHDIVHRRAWRHVTD